MEETYSIIVGQNGKNLLAVNGYKFYFKHKAKDNFCRWCCVKKSCPSKLYTHGISTLDVDFTKSNLQHNHDPDDTLNRQKVSNVLKRKLRENTSLLRQKPSKIVKDISQSGDLKLTKTDFARILRNVHNVKKAALSANISADDKSHRIEINKKEDLINDVVMRNSKQLAVEVLFHSSEDEQLLLALKGLPLQQDGGAIVSEPVPSTSTAPCETFVAEDECMEREDLAFIKNEEVILSEDEEKDVAVGFHDYTSTAMTDITDSSTDLKNPLPPLIRQVPEPKTETVTNTAEVCDRRYEAPNTTGCAQDVNELFAKYLVAELRSLHPDDAALLRKKIHCLVADFMIYETGSRAASVQESRVSGSERLS